MVGLHTHTHFGYQPSRNLGCAIFYSIMLPINIIGLSFNLAFVVIPILNGWFYPQKIVALAGWDGDAVEDEEESPRDETEMELVDETEIV